MCYSHKRFLAVESVTPGPTVAVPIIGAHPHSLIAGSPTLQRTLAVRRNRNIVPRVNRSQQRISRPCSAAHSAISWLRRSAYVGRPSCRRASPTRFTAYTRGRRRKSRWRTRRPVAVRWTRRRQGGGRALRSGSCTTRRAELCLDRPRRLTRDWLGGPRVGASVPQVQAELRAAARGCGTTKRARMSSNR